MIKHTHVALAFAAALAATAPSLSFGDDETSLSSLFARFAEAASVRGAKVCAPTPTANAAALLHFKALHHAGKIEPTALMMSAAFTKAGEFSVCTSPVVAEGGADAYLFLGTLNNQERTILLNPTLKEGRQEEALLAAIDHARDLFAQNNQNRLSDEALAMPRALKVQRNWLGHVTGASVIPLPPEQLTKLPGVFSQVENYIPSQPAIVPPAAPPVPPVTEPKADTPSPRPETVTPVEPTPQSPTPPAPLPAPELDQIIVSAPQKGVPALTL